MLCLVDPRPEAMPVARELAVPLFNSVEHMLQQKHVPDAAFVCTPNKTHVAISSQLLLAGIHVLVEKPISTDIESGRSLIEIAKRSGKQLAVGHHRRFNPYIVATKQKLAEAAIGRVIAISGLWTTFKPDSYFQSPTEWRVKRGTGGPILINLVHEVDILQYLFGSIVRVHAEQTISQRGHEAEEGAAVLLRFASGVVGTFILSDAVVANHGFESGTGDNPIIPRSRKDFYRIFGSDGMLSVGDMKLSKHEHSDEKSWANLLIEEDVFVGREVPFDEQVKNFVRVVSGLEEPRCSGEDALKALIVCDAIQKAMDSGNAMDVSLAVADPCSELCRATANARPNSRRSESNILTKIPIVEGTGGIATRLAASRKADSVRVAGVVYTIPEKEGRDGFMDDFVNVVENNLSEDEFIQRWGHVRLNDDSVDDGNLQRRRSDCEE